MFSVTKTMFSVVLYMFSVMENMFLIMEKVWERLRGRRLGAGRIRLNTGWVGKG